MKCIRCESQRVVKAGFKKLAKIYEEKGEQRKIARILGVGLATVQYHLKKTQ